MSDILQQICAVKEQEVAVARAELSHPELRARAEAQPPAPDLVRALPATHPAARAAARRRRHYGPQPVGQKRNNMWISHDFSHRHPPEEAWWRDFVGNAARRRPTNRRPKDPHPGLL